MKITEQAAKQLREILKKQDNPEAGIKIYPTQGCCDISPGMDVANKPQKGENHIVIDGVNFFIDNELMDRMENTEIDLSPDGFRIHGFPKKNSCCD